MIARQTLPETLPKPCPRQGFERRNTTRLARFRQGFRQGFLRPFFLEIERERETRERKPRHLAAGTRGAQETRRERSSRVRVGKGQGFRSRLFGVGTTPLRRRVRFVGWAGRTQGPGGFQFRTLEFPFCFLERLLRLLLALPASRGRPVGGVAGESG